jgi:type I restriction enzyme, S subunit
VSEVIEQTAASWPQVVVSDVSELIRGVTYSKEYATDKPQDGYIPVLRATNIQESRLVLESDLVFVPDSNVSTNQRLRAGDIVVATSSGSKHLVGKSGLVHANWPGSFGAFCAAIRPKSNIESRYLAAFLQSPSYWEQVGKKALGVNINNLRRGDIESLTLPLPPLEKQREIVAELEKHFSRLDEAVANLQRVKANLKRYKASVLKAAVEGRLVETEASLARREGRSYEAGEQLLKRILTERRAKWSGKGKYKEPCCPKIEHRSALPQGWAYASIDQLAHVDVGFAFKSAEFKSGGIRLLRGENIEPGKLRWTETRYWPESRLAEFKNLLLEEGEIILAMDRPLISSGLKLARVRFSDLPCLLVQRVARLRCVDKGLESYLHSCMSTQVFERHLLDGQTGTQLPHVSGASIGAFVVPVPPASEQIRIAAEVDRHLSIIREVEAEVDANLQRAQALRQAILAKAFAVN